MTDIIVALILLIVIGTAAAYIVKAKKNGTKCIGCPHAKSCPSCNDKNTGCNCSSEK